MVKKTDQELDAIRLTRACHTCGAAVGQPCRRTVATLGTEEKPMELYKRGEGPLARRPHRMRGL